MSLGLALKYRLLMRDFLHQCRFDIPLYIRKEQSYVGDIAVCSSLAQVKRHGA